MRLDTKLLITHLFFNIITLLVLIVIIIFGFCILWLLFIVLIAWIVLWIFFERKLQRKYHEERLKKLKKSAELRIMG
jgi:Flp pilus assembly protein TadB